MSVGAGGNEDGDRILHERRVVNARIEILAMSRDIEIALGVVAIIVILIIFFLGHLLEELNRD